MVFIGRPVVRFWVAGDWGGREVWPVADLIPYARNSRTHNEEQIAQIMASIKEFGFTNPILIGSDNVIIAGHGRLLAAQRLGLTEVPVICLPALTETQRKALVIADNKIALNAGWNEEMLALEMAELSEADFDLDLLGFNPDELDDKDNSSRVGHELRWVAAKGYVACSQIRWNAQGLKRL